MIHTALQTITDRLNNYFRTRFGVVEKAVVLSGIVNQDGSVAIPETDRLVLTLVNVERENVVGSVKNPMGVTSKATNVNLYVLCSAYFSGNNYIEALKFLSAVVSFFQANSLFNQQNTPELGEQIDRLSFELFNLDLQSQSQLWGTLGGKYMPSVMYKVRMIVFQEGNLQEFPSFIAGSSGDFGRTE